MIAARKVLAQHSQSETSEVAPASKSTESRTSASLCFYSNTAVLKMTSFPLETGSHITHCWPGLCVMLNKTVLSIDGLSLEELLPNAITRMIYF